MEVIERILTEAPDYLAPAGILYIEHEPEQRDAIHQIAADLPYTSCGTCADQYGVMRYTRLTRAPHA
jgi:methylase of polypeptide subunit release factors